MVYKWCFETMRKRSIWNDHCKVKWWMCEWEGDMHLRLKGVRKHEQLTLQMRNLQLEFKEGIGVFQVAKARIHILGKHKLSLCFPSKQCIEPRLQQRRRYTRANLEWSSFSGPFGDIGLFTLTFPPFKCYITGSPGLCRRPPLEFLLRNYLSQLSTMTRCDGNSMQFFLRLNVFLFKVCSPSINHLLCGRFPGILHEERQQGHAKHWETK